MRKVAILKDLSVVDVKTGEIRSVLWSRNAARRLVYWYSWVVVYNEVE